MKGFDFFSILLGLGLGAIGGGAFVASTISTVPETTHHTPHPQTEVAADLPIPVVDLEIKEDLMGGYNIHIITENFRFTPENVNTEYQPNEGHAHLYVNDRKINRLYGSWYLLSANELQEGENEIMVTLNANDHNELTHNGEHIQATQTITFSR